MLNGRAKSDRKAGGGGSVLTDGGGVWKTLGWGLMDEGAGLIGRVG